MNRSILKGIVLAAALTIGAPAAWAANTATTAVTTTSIPLPPAPQEKPAQPVAPTTETAVTATEPPYMPEVQAPDEVKSAGVASWVVYTALGIAILALLIGIGLSVFAYLAYREINEYADRTNAKLDSHGKKLKNLNEVMHDIGRELSNLSSLVVINQRETRKAQSAFDSDWAHGSEKSNAPSAPPPPQQASPGEVADLLDAYRLVLAAKGPDQLASFKAAYQPITLSVTAEDISEARDGDDNVWMITKPHWGGEGIVLPGSHAIRAWGTTFQPSSGRAAQNQFGPIYTVLPGNVLEVEHPARVVRNASGHIVLSEKGTLRGA